MKLGVYVLDGVRTTCTNNYGLPAFGGNSAVVAANTLPAGYDDISTIEGWATYGMGAGKDYKYVRGQIGLLVGEIGWSGLTAAEKSIAASWFLVPKTQRDELYSLEQQIGLGILFHVASVGARQKRLLLASMQLYNRLSSEAVNTLNRNTEKLRDEYVLGGLEGTLEGDGEGLFDYIEARTGTAYETTGLAAQAYSPIGTTLPELVTKIMSILKDGIY